MELVHPNEWNQLQPCTPYRTMWIILETPFFDSKMIVKVLQVVQWQKMSTQNF